MNLSNNDDVKDVLREMFDAAIASAAPGPAVLENLPEKPRGRCVVVGAGKASAAMAATLDSAWPDVELSGVVSTRYGHAVPTERVTIVEAGHPVPDEASEGAARAMLEAVTGLSADDLVVALVSGGGSATLALPVEVLSLAEKQDITHQLLNSGATIEEINVVRTHLSQVKGGRLAAAAGPARLVSLLISDIPGDEPAAIASGPTLPCKTVPSDALDIVDRLGIRLSEPVRRYLSEAEGSVELRASDYRIIASSAQALAAAAEKAMALGFRPIMLGDDLQGESRELGQSMAASAQCLRDAEASDDLPAVLISGGETSVSIGPGVAGRGGRNTEFLLSLALALKAERGVYALAGDSDGIDGTEDAAGAIVTPDTLSRAKALGLDAHDFLQRHDSYSLFEQLGDLVKTGPTLTNVNDIRIVLISAQ